MTAPKTVRDMNATEYAAARRAALSGADRDAAINRQLTAEIDRAPRPEPAGDAQADARTLSPAEYRQARQRAIRAAG